MMPARCRRQWRMSRRPTPARTGLRLSPPWRPSSHAKQQPHRRSPRRSAALRSATRSRPGPFLGADIRFCTAYGLNVHGKALFFLIHSATHIEIVTDRNIHDRLILAAGTAYNDWAARRSPGSDALSLTLDAMPVALGDA